MAACWSLDLIYFECHPCADVHISFPLQGKHIKIETSAVLFIDAQPDEDILASVWAPFLLNVSVN